jgi:uncharacterized membrane protein
MLAIGPTAFALISAISYGAGDFLGGRASTRLPTLTVLLIAQVAACAVAVLAAGGVSLSGVDQASLMLGIAGGVAHVAAVGFLYHGLAHGRVCVIAPVSGIVNIALPVLVDGVAINGLSLVQSLGILMSASAVALVSCCGSSGLGQLARSPRLDVAHGALSGILFGIADLSLGSVAPEAAGDAVLAARLVGAAGIAAAFIVMNLHVIAAALARGQVSAFAPSGKPPGGRMGAGVLLALAAGAGDCLGHLSYALSATNGEISVAVATSALFPAVSVLLAILILKERIGRVQSVGLAVSAGSIVLLAGA